MKFKENQRQRATLQPKCASGEMLTLDAIEALTRAAEEGGRVSLNGLEMTVADLHLLAEAVRSGAMFCLLRARVEEQASAVTGKQADGWSTQGVGWPGAAWRKVIGQVKSLELGRAMAAGLAGVVVMTVTLILPSLIGLPNLDLARLLGSLLADAPPEPGAMTWVAGLGLHLMVGTVVLSTGYALTHPYLLTSTPLGKGLLYSLIVWFMAQILAMPVMGAGLFSSKLPQSAVMAGSSLLGHLIYGAILGSIYGSRQAEHSAKRLSSGC